MKWSQCMVSVRSPQAAFDRVAARSTEEIDKVQPGSAHSGDRVVGAGIADPDLRFSTLRDTACRRMAKTSEPDMRKRARSLPSKRMEFGVAMRRLAECVGRVMSPLSLDDGSEPMQPPLREERPGNSGGVDTTAPAGARPSPAASILPAEPEPVSFDALPLQSLFSGSSAASLQALERQLNAVCEEAHLSARERDALVHGLICQGRDQPEPAAAAGQALASMNLIHLVDDLSHPGGLGVTGRNVAGWQLAGHLATGSADGIGIDLIDKLSDRRFLPALGPHFRPRRGPLGAAGRRHVKAYFDAVREMAGSALSVRFDPNGVYADPLLKAALLDACPPATGAAGESPRPLSQAHRALLALPHVMAMRPWEVDNENLCALRSFADGPLLPSPTLHRNDWHPLSTRSISEQEFGLAVRVAPMMQAPLSTMHGNERQICAPSQGVDDLDRCVEPSGFLTSESPSKRKPVLRLSELGQTGRAAAPAAASSGALWPSRLPPELAHAKQLTAVGPRLGEGSTGYVIGVAADGVFQPELVAKIAFKQMGDRAAKTRLQILAARQVNEAIAALDAANALKHVLVMQGAVWMGGLPATLYRRIEGAKRLGEATSRAMSLNEKVAELYQQAIESEPDQPCLKPEEFARILSRLLKGPCRDLAGLNARKVVMNDLHPGNMLYDPLQDIVVLSDFDNGGFIGQHSDHGKLETTAPEHLDAQSTLSCWTDAYSFGASIHAMVHGEPPTWSEAARGLTDTPRLFMLSLDAQEFHHRGTIYPRGTLAHCTENLRQPGNVLELRLREVLHRSGLYELMEELMRPAIGTASSHKPVRWTLQQAVHESRFFRLDGDGAWVGT